MTLEEALHITGIREHELPILNKEALKEVIEETQSDVEMFHGGLNNRDAKLLKAYKTIERELNRKANK